MLYLSVDCVFTILFFEFGIDKVVYLFVSFLIIGIISLSVLKLLPFLIEIRSCLQMVISFVKCWKQNVPWKTFFVEWQIKISQFSEVERLTSKCIGLRSYMSRPHKISCVALGYGVWKCR